MNEKDIQGARTGANFLQSTRLNSMFEDFNSLDISDDGENRKNLASKITSSVPQTGRPSSMRGSLDLKTVRRPVNRSIKLKDSIANNYRQSADFKTAGGPVGNAFMNKSGAGFNLGSIMNFKKMEGINDMSKEGSFRKWTGMPQTTRLK